MNWKILSERQLLKVHPWFEISKQSIELPDGQQVHDYYQINQPSYCEIAVKDHNKRILIHKSYKHGVRNVTLGFPGGYINKNETPIDSAYRELHEECELSAAHWLELGSYVIDGNRGEAKAHLFMAEGLTSLAKIPSDDLEDTKSFWVNKNELQECIKSDQFKTLGASLLAEKVLVVI